MPHRTVAVLSFLALLTTTPARAGEDGSLVLPGWTFSTEDTCASSGLRIVVVRDARTPVVTLVSVVDAGSADDPPGKEGLAGLTGYLATRGSVGPGEEVSDALGRLGAHDVSTLADQSLFTIRVPRSELGAALSIEGQRLADPLRGIDARTVAHGVRVMVERHRGGSLDVVGSGGWYARLFPEPHPYARLDSATPEGLAGLTLDDVRTFVAQHYRPANTSLHVVGDVTSATLLAEVSTRFPDELVGVPAGTAPRRCGAFAAAGAEPPAPRHADTWVEREAPVTTPRVYFSWSVPGGLDERAGIGELATGLLQAVAASRVPDDWLRRRLSCDLEPMREASVVTCAMSPEPGVDRDELARRVLGAAAEVWRAPAYGEGLAFSPGVQVLFRRLSAAGERLVDPIFSGSLSPFLQSHVTGDARYPAPLLNYLSNAAFDEVTRYVQRWFGEDRAVRAHVQPLTSTPDTPTEVPDSAPVEPAPVPVVDPVLVERRAAAPAAEEIAVETLPNGLTAAVLRRAGVPRVELQVVFRGLPTAGALPGLADVVDVETTYSTKTVLNEPKVEPLDRSTLASGWVTDRRASGTWWSGPAPLLERMLWEVRRELASAGLDTVGATDPAQLLGEAYDRYLDDPASQVAALAWGRLFGDNPWVGRSSHAAWRAAQVSPVKHHRAVLHGARRPENALLLIVGDVDPTEAFALVRRHFGRWPGPDVPAPPQAWTPVGDLPPAAGITLVDSPTLTTVRAASACRLAQAPKLGLRDTVEQLAIAEVSRALRRTGVLAYDVWADTGGDPVGGDVLQLGATLPLGSAERGRRLLVAVLDELAAIDDPGRVSLAALRSATLEALRRSTLPGLIAQLRTAMVSPTGASTFTRRAQERATITPADVRALVRPCRDRVEYVFLGPSAVIRAGLATGGLPIQEINWAAFHAERTGRAVR